MKSKQEIFSAKLSELEEEYVRLQNRIRLFQEKDERQILEELGRLASAQTGVPARCAVKVGKAPAAPAAAAPAQAAEHDKLDDLLAFSRQFDNIIIQE